MNYIAIISVLVVIIFFLIYISVSNKGWNCTENGCVYVSNGSFTSQEKCNSYCKSNSKTEIPNESKIVSNTTPILQSVVNPYNPYVAPYGYYHPSFYYNDWNRRDRDRYRDRDREINNNNHNNIVINQPSATIPVPEIINSSPTLSP